MNAVDDIINIINRIPGKKQVMLHKAGWTTPYMTIDVSASGQWGYPVVWDGPELAMFRAKLNTVLHSELGSNLIVRRFLDTMHSETIPNKVLYGLIFNKGQYRPIPPEALADCYEVAPWGHRRPTEPGVTYGRIVEFFDARMLSDILNPEGNKPSPN